MDITKLKVGDHIMYDRGGVAYAIFALVEDIEKRPMQFGKEKIILKLRDVYKRERLTKDGTMSQDVFTYEYQEKLYVSPDSRKLIEEKIYKLTKAEYNAVEKAVRAYFQARENTMDITRRLYFDKKRK